MPLADTLRILDLPIAEQVIEVPKISCSPCPSRFLVPEPQSADQLVEVPTVLTLTRIALRIAEQIVNTPVPQGRGLGFLPEQSTTAQTVEQLVHIPFSGGGLFGSLPGQSTTAAPPHHTHPPPPPPRFKQVCVAFGVPCCSNLDGWPAIAERGDAGGGTGSARHWRERLLRSHLRHEWMAVAMALAESTHHSAAGREARDALHGHVPEAPLPKTRVLRRVVGHLAVPALDVPVPQMVHQLPDIEQFFRVLSPDPEQVIEVPKILPFDVPMRAAVRVPQLAEQLVEVPTIISCSSLEQLHPPRRQVHSTSFSTSTKHLPAGARSLTGSRRSGRRSVSSGTPWTRSSPHLCSMFLCRRWSNSCCWASSGVRSPSRLSKCLV